MDTFVETYNLPKQNKGEAESLNTAITAVEIEGLIKKFPTHKSLDQMVSQKISTKHLKKS